MFATVTNLEGCLSKIPSTERTSNESLLVCTNEKNLGATYKKMRAEPLVGDLVVGVSGFFTLNLAAMRGETAKKEQRPLKGVLILDCSLRVEHFWKDITAVVKEEESVIAAAAKIKQLIQKKRNKYFHPCGQGCCTVLKRTQEQNKFLKLDISNGTSWLSSDTRYNTIRTLMLEGNIVFKRINLFDLNAVKKIKAAVESEWKVDTFYASNLFEYGRKEGQSSYANLRHSCMLLTQQTPCYLIMTDERKDDKEPLRQRVIKLT